MWYRAFGWRENPFSIRPSPVVVGLAETKEALLSDLLAGSPALLLGPTGAGKTSLLLWLREQIRLTPFRPVYLSLHSPSDPQEKALLLAIQRGLLQQRIRLRFKAGLIILFDEAQELNQTSASLLQEAFDRGFVRSFLLAACAEPPLPQPLRSRIGPNLYRLESLALPERLALLKHRMDGKNPFTEEALALLAENAGPSPRALLQAAEFVCKRLVFKAELTEPITPADLTPLLPALAHPSETPIPTMSRRETTPPPPPEPSRETSETELRETTIPTVSQPPEPLPSTRRDKRDHPRETKFRSLSQTKGKRATTRDKSLSPMQEELLRLLLSGPKTVEELSAALRSPPGSVRRQLSRLRDLALIESLPGSNPKKFALTEEAVDTLPPVDN